ncbi:unnamed protein product [Cylicostephanus goldi]|uniref:DUF4440 domain-containing protein n=1 Tax=Cylicostephanus goldi TaxID=71465 RepID=A0A3P6QXB1_CYLGO|nr:unnamed protein product [Cylicostephanus goldi]
MKNEEAAAIMKSIADAWEKDYYAGKLEKVIQDYFHTDCVVVQKGENAVYGKKIVTEMFKKMEEEYGQVKFERKNEKCCGCDSCICMSCDVIIESPKKGKELGKSFQIWRKEGGKWKCYHDEFEIMKSNTRV